MAEQNEKSVYDLELHEKTHIPEAYTTALRVPGGWIYTVIHSHNQGMSTVSQSISSTFVPLTNEGKKRDNQSSGVVEPGVY